MHVVHIMHSVTWIKWTRKTTTWGMTCIQH